MATNTTTTSASLRTDSLNRRAALGAIVAASVVSIGSPAAALTAHPDAELFAMAKRAKALSEESDAAEMALADLEDAFEPPPPPDCLLIRAGDEIFAAAKDGEFADKIGTGFSEYQLGVVRSMRVTYQDLFSGPSRLTKLLGGKAPALLARATEIDLGASSYLAEIETAKVAAGIRAAGAKCEALTDEIKAAWRELAFFPARTVDGALAKIEAIAHCFDRPKPEQHPEECTCDVVLEMAANEVAELRLGS